MSSFNDAIIEEFRANGGKVGGQFESVSMLLLTTTGRNTGRQVVSPLVYTRSGDAYVVAASNAGSDSHPQWYLNLLANPGVTVEVGDASFGARAEIASAAERDRLFAAHAEAMPAFAEYEKATNRVIPMVTLNLES